jgi:HEAT repeat protein
MAAGQLPQVVEGFLKELMGAKKALKLYPAGNPLADQWLQRLQRSFESAVKDGLPSLLRIEPGRFAWEGGQLETKHPSLESFRFELETRRITELGVEPGVEPRELREFLDCLNLRHEEVEAAGGLPVLLGQRSVVHIVVRGPSWREGRGAVGASSDGERFALLEALVGIIMEELAERFRTLSYDRVQLSAWFLELAHDDERADVVFSAVQMLIPMVENEPDREVRFRTLNECLMALPDPLRSVVFSAWLMPAVRTDLNMVSLLTRFSGDEFAELVGLIPADTLQALRADIEAIPAEEWKKARITESLEDALAEKQVAATPLGDLVADDDPDLAAFREAARAGCGAEPVLAHSVDILFHLLAETESEAYPALLIDALEEATTEALSRERLPLALRVLRALAQGERLRPEWLAEHQRRLQLLNRRLAARSQVELLAEILRRSESPENVQDAIEYVRMVGVDAIGELVAIFADEPDGGGRTRLLEVLTALGPAAGPALRARVADGYWQVTRTVISLLARLGDPAALDAIQKAAAHEHPHVRREVARAVAALAGKSAMRQLLGYLSDPDAEVRLTAIKLLGGLMDASTVGPLREFLVAPTRTTSDLMIKREIITGLASIGSREARAVLQAIAQRRVWPWQRNELTVRDLAGEAIKAMVRPAAAARGA